jgi:hypothetical protein
MESTDRNSITSFNKLLTSLSHFSQYSNLLHNLYLKNSNSESHNNPTRGSVAQAATEKNKRIDEISTEGVIFFYFKMESLNIA